MYLQGKFLVVCKLSLTQNREGGEKRDKGRRRRRRRRRVYSKPTQ